MRIALLSILVSSTLATSLVERSAVAAPSSCRVIHLVFDPAEGNGAEACRVARCESSLDRFATNGQYLGLFQLGSWARSRFLRGAWFSAWENARAALRLYRSNGHRWSGQWECSWAA